MLLPLCRLAGQDAGPTAKYRVIRDIPYMQGVSSVLEADAYLPEATAPAPGILFIHGGGWVDGNRNQMQRLIKEVAEQGYVAFTIEYDVDPVHFPTSLEESLEAVRYFREHAAMFHLDPTRIAVAGSSAGGELAALVALTPAAGVQAAVILNGVLDLESLGDTSQMVTKYLGGTCSSLPEACAAASPVRQVHPMAPPFYVGHGTADKTVPFSQAQQMVAELQKAKVPVTLFVAQDGPHTYWANERFYKKNVEQMEAFLSESLHWRSGRKDLP
jgi:acetyl esterase/lipase